MYEPDTASSDLGFRCSFRLRTGGSSAPASEGVAFEVPVSEMGLNLEHTLTVAAAQPLRTCSQLQK